MIKAWIFDLDNCLLDTPALGKESDFFQPVLDALRGVSGKTPEELQKMEELLWTLSLDDAARQCGWSEAEINPAREAYRRVEVTADMVVQGYGDSEVIAQLRGPKFLVTTGYQKFQQGKIERLGIGKLFDAIAIDTLDEPWKRLGKRRIFEDLLLEHGWKPSEVAVVGDNPLSELGAAQSLGMITVQTVRPGIRRWGEADYQVEHLRELLELEG